MNIKPLLSIFLYLSCAASTLVYSDTIPSHTVIEDLAKEPILTPSFKSRKVLKIRLTNNLEAVLISDPLIEQSAAAMTVKTGSFEDTEETPGIAHFLEHMLFLGTKKYPQESGYQHFIAENGGLTNAFTTNDFTSYLFTVNNNAFEEALDRFSEFFKEPLFNPSGVSRELQAIDQEYAKNVQNDDIRTMYVIKETSNKKHPYHEFGMGNSSTLSKVSQNTLIDWYKKHYSANLMRLIVYSKLPLDKLESLVVENFREIANSNKQPMATPSIPIDTKDSEGKIFYIEPVKNIRTLSLVWNMPEKFANVLDKQPDAIVCHVIGDESENSLLAHLKMAGLAEALGCGSFKIGPGSQVFYMEVDLTEEGVKSVDSVIEQIFQALAVLKKNDIPSYLFDDVQQIAKIKYRYKNREDLFETLMKDVMKLPYENLDTYPVQSSIVQKFDPSLIKEFVNFLTPSNARFFLAAPSELTSVNPTITEKWLGVKYGVKPISNQKMEEWNKVLPIPEVSLPLPNSFIPKNLTILNKIESSDHDLIPIPKPQLILDSERGKIYFAHDSFFGTPEVYLHFEVKTPEIKSGFASSVVFADLYVKALKDSLNKLSYPAIIAGLNYDIKRSDNGIEITISGYSENANLLFEEIVKRLNLNEITEEKFAILKDSLLREYENAYKSSPLKAASDLMKSVLYKYYTVEPEKALAIKKLDFAIFNEKLQYLFKQNYLEGMVYGNLTESNALTLKEILLNSLPKKSYPKANQQLREVVILPQDKGPFYIEKKVDVQGNAIIVLVEESDFSIKTRAAQSILMQAIGSPFFSTLRTKQQTGYLVDSSGEEIEKKLFNLFIIQSNTHDTHALLSRIELFIESYLQEIETNLTKENFETIKAVLIQNLTHAYNNTKAMGELLNHLAFKYDADFEWMNKRIKALQDITYAEVLETAREIFGKTNKQRLAIMIDGVVPNEKTLNYIKVQTLKQLRKLSGYSSGNCCDFYRDKVR